VGVTVGLLSAQADDFNSLTGQFQFSAGQQKAVLSTLIKGDAVPEPDETATLRHGPRRTIGSRHSNRR